jgi:predicted Zn-dependent protease with MMP-like domain
MLEINDQEFEELVATAVDEIPQHYKSNMNNVAFVTANDPTPEQRLKLHLVNGMTLFGLYEGVPLTQRTGNYSGVLPDKITIFKNPLVAQAHDREALKELVKNTVWHEVAHHFGLGHGRIHELERGSNKNE